MIYPQDRTFKYRLLSDRIAVSSQTGETPLDTRDMTNKTKMRSVLFLLFQQYITTGDY